MLILTLWFQQASHHTIAYLSIQGCLVLLYQYLRSARALYILSLALKWMAFIEYTKHGASGLTTSHKSYIFRSYLKMSVIHRCNRWLAQGVKRACSLRLENEQTFKPILKFVTEEDPGFSVRGVIHCFTKSTGGGCRNFNLSFCLKSLEKFDNWLFSGNYLLCRLVSKTSYQW